MPTGTPAVVHVADQPGTDDDAKVANAIAWIKSNVHWSHHSATMVFESGRWTFDNPIVIDWPVSVTSRGVGANSCQLIWTSAIAGQTCFKHEFSSRNEVSNLSLQLASDGINNVTMLMVSDCGRNTYRNLAILPGTKSGKNNVGIFHERGVGSSGRGESNWFSELNIVAPRPIVINSGNSLTFTNADIGVYNSSSIATDGDQVNAAFTFLNPAWQVKFRDMSVQKGKHLLYCKYQGPNCGNQLTLDDIRYEQQTDHREPAIYYHTTRANGLFGQEMLTLINPRFSHLPISAPVTNVGGVARYSIVGGWWYGADTHVGQRPKTMWG